MEQWCEIPGYNGDYLISSEGRVKSFKTVERILSSADNGKGYQVVSLWLDGKHKMHYIHRLVAQAFIPNPNILPQVNHKDENKKNNNIHNLEWCDNAYNNLYGTKRVRQGESLLNNENHKTKKRVYKLSLNGEKIASYRSMREAERENNLCNGSISAYFRNNYTHTGGYKWLIIE